MISNNAHTVYIYSEERRGHAPSSAPPLDPPVMPIISVVHVIQVNNSRSVGGLFQPEHPGDGQAVSELGGTACDRGRRAADGL